MEGELLELRFTGELWFWRGPAPFFFVIVPDKPSSAIRAIARAASYGWGAIPVTAAIANRAWETSIFPKEGHYLVPITAAIRVAEGLADGDAVTMRLAIRW